MKNRVYLCIDLKSFYASVECVLRGLDPLTTNLVVADNSRTEKTICLAVSPSLKQYGIGGRSRLFEVVKRVKEINYERKKNNKYRNFIGKSYNDIELKNNSSLELDYIIATPRMKFYMDYSTRIFNTYLKYVSNDDIFSYSIDEVFCDITNYLRMYNKTPQELAAMMIKDVYDTTGITATAGVGTNMYLAKVAMDIVAKHCDANEFGVRMATLDEMSYRKLLWNHRPLTSFWRVGPGYQKKLEENHIYTMGDIARCSINNEDLLYKLFGVNAELLIDHAWGYEPCTIKDVKAYKPETNSISSGQVLHSPYDYDKTKLIVKEMMDLLSLDLVSKNLVTDTLVLTIGYDIECLTNPNIKKLYSGPITFDRYGRVVPKPAHGTIRVDHKTSSSKLLIDKIVELYEKIINKNLLIRRINICACNVINKDEVKNEVKVEQLDLFTNYEEKSNKEKIVRKNEEDENSLQKVMIDIKNKYGKNAILKGMNLEKGATTIDRNSQIGGHRG